MKNTDKMQIEVKKIQQQTNRVNIIEVNRNVIDWLKLEIRNLAKYNKKEIVCLTPIYKAYTETHDR